MSQQAIETTHGTNRGAERHNHRGAVVLLALLSLLPMFLASCGTDVGANGQLASDQTFVWPYTAGTSVSDLGLDPATVVSLYQANNTQLIYTNLVALDSTLHVVPDAAQHWDVSSDGKTYTFHIKSNLKFSDGTALTAADFAYSINRTLSPCTASPVNYYLAMLKDAGTFSSEQCTGNTIQGDIKSLIGDALVVQDPQTLVINLQQSANYLLEALTYPAFDPVEKSLVENTKWASGDWANHLDQGGCSGPFMVKSYGNGKQMTYIPNPNWEQAFGKKLTITSVVRPLLATEDVAYQNYRAGTFGYDEADVPPSLYSQAFGEPDFHEVPSLSTDYFALNTKMAPFDSQIVRVAFDLALNRQLMVDRVSNGGTIPTIHIVPQGMPGYNSQLVNPSPDGTQSITGNQDAAVKLLKQAQADCATQAPAGAKGQTGKTTPAQPDYCPYITGATPDAIDFYVPSDQTNQAVGHAAASQWKAVLGVNVNVIPIDFGALVGELYGHKLDPQMYKLGWSADYPDPQDWLSFQFTGTAPNNFMHLDDSALNALLDKADKSASQSERFTLYAQAEQMVVNVVAWIPYAQGRTSWRMTPKVRGFAYDTFGIMEDLAWPNVQILAS